MFSLVNDLLFVLNALMSFSFDAKTNGRAFTKESTCEIVFPETDLRVNQNSISSDF